jgi:hypothetical protein
MQQLAGELDGEDVRWMRESKRGRGGECTSRVMEGKGHSSTVGVVLSLALGPFGAPLVTLGTRETARVGAASPADAMNEETDNCISISGPPALLRLRDRQPQRDLSTWPAPLAAASHLRK